MFSLVCVFFFSLSFSLLLSSKFYLSFLLFFCFSAPFFFLFISSMLGPSFFHYLFLSCFSWNFFLFFLPFFMFPFSKQYQKNIGSFFHVSLYFHVSCSFFISIKWIITVVFVWVKLYKRHPLIQILASYIFVIPFLFSFWLLHEVFSLIRGDRLSWWMLSFSYFFGVQKEEITFPSWVDGLIKTEIIFWCSKIYPVLPTGYILLLRSSISKAFDTRGARCQTDVWAIEIHWSTFLFVALSVLSIVTVTTGSSSNIIGFWLHTSSQCVLQRPKKGRKRSSSSSGTQRLSSSSLRRRPFTSCSRCRKCTGWLHRLKLLMLYNYWEYKVYLINATKILNSVLVLSLLYSDVGIIFCLQLFMLLS